MKRVLSDTICDVCGQEAPCACAYRDGPSGESIPLCDTCDGTKTGKREVDWTGEQYFPCTCPKTLYPTFNWKSFALNLARAVEDKDEDAMHDLAKDARLFEAIPCPSVTIGGPDGGKWPSAPEGGRDQ